MATAAPSNTYTTISAIGNREDLSNIIYNVDPIDCPVVASIERASATAVLHEWQTDAYAAATRSNARVEGADAITLAATATVRESNTCQIMDKVARVSGTQRAVNSAGRADELEYQVLKRTMELRRDMEGSVLGHVAEATGDTTTARAFGQLGTWLTSNLDQASDAVTSAGRGNGARTDGTPRALTESMLKNVLRSCWNNGGDPEAIVVGSFNKQVISGFAGNATRMKTAEDKKLVAAIDLYDSDFGELQVIPDRFCRPILGGSDTTGDLWVIQKDMLALATLRPVGIEPLAKTGDSDQRQILTEMTLEVRNQKSCGAVFDLTIS